LSSEELRRGDELRITLTMRHESRTTQALEVGLVCRETYDEQDSDGDRTTSTDTAYEQWLEGNPSLPLQHFTLTVPADGPFSYRGVVLAFTWYAAAREPARVLPDPTSRREFLVLP
jgi:hypothetical protein